MSGIREYIEACQYRKSFLSNQRHILVQERQAFDQDARRLEGVLERIRQELVGYLLPEVSDAYLEALETRLAYPGLRPIKQRFDDRFDETERRRVELAAMDAIEFHDLELEQATQRVEEIRPAFETFRKKVSLWEDSKWFWRLDKRGYFQVDYNPGLFRRFWDWRAVSFLMSHMEKKGGQKYLDPEDLKFQYRNLRDEADAVFAAYNTRTGERDRIVALKQEYDEVLAAPERLLSELYRELGQAALEHLQSCPEELRLNLVKDDPNLNAFLKKEQGVQKQVQYLRELSVTRLDSRRQQLDQEINKLDAKISKLEMQRRRGKRKRYSAADITRTRQVKAEQWRKRHEQTQKLRSRIVQFDSYENGSWLTSYLWWDLMTRGARGDDLFEVRDFHQRHPDWNYKSYRDPTTDPASVGYGIMHDAPLGNQAMDDAAEDLADSMMTPGADRFTDAS